MQITQPIEATIVLDREKLLGLRNLTETAPLNSDLEASADDLFQKRGTERAA